MSTPARKARSGQETKAAARQKGEVAQRKPKASPELRKAAERDVSRAETLEALYRPLREAGEAELQKTKSGRKLLEDAHEFARDLDELYKSVTSGRTSAEEGHQLAQERQEAFRKRYGDQFQEAHARHVRLQPSVEEVAQILDPEMAAQRTWISEASPMRSMLLQPKATPEDVGIVSQGLGDPPPPIVQACITPPYGEKDENMVVPALFGLWPFESWGRRETGMAAIGGNTFTTALFHIEAFLASAFVGQDFPVPPGPTSYTTTISYDWWCSGYGFACFGIAVVNTDLAIVIDKRDGTRETHAREVSLLTVPVLAGDGFSHHDADGVKVTIPFTRDGSNGTVRIMVGADGHCMVAALTGYARFMAEVKVREICLTSVG